MATDSPTDLSRQQQIRQLVNKEYSYSDAIRALRQLAVPSPYGGSSLEDVFATRFGINQVADLQRWLDSGYIPIMVSATARKWRDAGYQNVEDVLIVMDKDMKPSYWHRGISGGAKVLKTIGDQRQLWEAAKYHWFVWSTTAPPMQVGEWWRKHGYKYRA